MKTWLLAFMLLPAAAVFVSASRGPVRDGGAGGGITEVSDDTTPQSGGEWDLAGFGINDDTGNNIVDLDDSWKFSGAYNAIFQNGSYIDDTADGILRMSKSDDSKTAAFDLSGLKFSFDANHYLDWETDGRLTIGNTSGNIFQIDTASTGLTFFRTNNGNTTQTMAATTWIALASRTASSRDSQIDNNGVAVGSAKVIGWSSTTSAEDTKDVTLSRRSTTGMKLANGSLTSGGTDDAGLEITQTLNDPGAAGGSDVYRGLKLNLTETNKTGWNSVYLADLQVGGTSKFNVDDSGNATAVGSILSTATGSIGWSVQSAADQACNTTCTSACVFGQNTGDMSIVACTDATADVCVCAGAS